MKGRIPCDPNTGITLIALIITIVILIILAGVTISISFKENGIFQKTKQAADAYQTASEQEQKKWIEYM